MTTTRKTSVSVDDASHIVNRKTVDDNTTSDLASSTPVDDPSHDNLDIVHTHQAFSGRCTPDDWLRDANAALAEVPPQAIQQSRTRLRVQRGAWLLSTASQLPAEIVQLFIAHGRSYGAWDERCILTEEEASLFASVRSGKMARQCPPHCA